MDVSEQMLATVSNAKKEAEKAESAFDARSSSVEIQSKSSINLFGGNATNQVVDIASAVREACDELYASYQTLIAVLDEECRPLLSQNPSVKAVKEVTALIQRLNSESEIGSNFTGSLNGSSLGGLVSVKYVPRMENKMIQKYWESKYSAMPGTAAEDAAYSRRQADERAAKRKAEQELKQMMRDIEREEREEAKKQAQLEKAERASRASASAVATQQRREYLRLAQRMISSGESSHMCLKQDGTPILFHNFFYDTAGNIACFKDIQAVACTSDGVVGLRRDGTCITSNPGKYCNAHISEANNWHNIVDLAGGGHHVVGLQNDGTCVATSIKWNTGYGYDGQSDVATWNNIQAVACGDYFSAGLKKDGTVVCAGKISTPNWKDVELIGAGGRCLMGVTKSGELLIAGEASTKGMEKAENIVQLAVANGIAYALQTDGTVLGGRMQNYSSKDRVVAAAGVVAIAGGDGLLLLQKDGYLKQLGSSIRVKVDSSCRLFEDYDGLVSEKDAAAHASLKKARQQKEYREANLCQHCGGSFKKSFFSCKCASCGRSKDY